jgi:glyoxylase-like metal-dependent hydrolase (beta-lactamase superfamily II)
MSVIQRVLAPNAGPMTGTGTNTYLVEQAGDVAVIDPGPDDSAHIEAILKAAEALGRITAVLVTHRHEDHLPAARPICARTGAPLLGHADLPGVDRAVSDGEACFNGLEALTTPGHTRESLCFWDRSERALFTGDLVAGAGTVIVDDQPGALGQYMGSLERLLALDPRTIYPGHGAVVEDGVGKLREYLAHRRQRETQVVGALAARGPSTVDDLVSAIYTDVAPGLVPMAARNVRAHLEKLVNDGRVTERQSRWQLTS